MWHKVNPIAFRIPYIKTWKSTWYEDKKKYTSSLWTDIRVREILKAELKWIPLWDILVSKDQDIVKVVIYTAKSSLILGKTWENKERIKTLLSRKLSSQIDLEVRDIKNPDLNCKIVWYNISNQIEQRMPYKRAIKQAISKTMEKWAKWIKVKVGWRLNWAEIARKETFKQWNIPTQTIRSDIDFIAARAETVYGTIGLKIWIYKWDIFKK
jgi:small subunit ribosomal protein S3